MSELTYYMKCPNCNKKTTFLFAGSGTKGTCMSCGYNLPPEKRYDEYKGKALDYI